MREPIVFLVGAACLAIGAMVVWSAVEDRSSGNAVLERNLAYRCGYNSGMIWAAKQSGIDLSRNEAHALCDKYIPEGMK